MTDDIDTRIGTVDLPERVDRERYFRELTYLELSALFAGPLKSAALTKWAEVAPPGTIGLAAPSVLTHRSPPKAANPWPPKDHVGDFRAADKPESRAAANAVIAQLKAAVERLRAGYVVFRSPPVFSASAANRTAMETFFAEVATEDSLGAKRVWVPDGLWDVRTAMTFAKQIGVICAFDPLVRDPGQPPEIYYDFEVTELYLRVSGLGRSGPIRSERMDDLVALLEHYEGVPATIAFDSPARWADARNLKKTLAGEA